MTRGGLILHEELPYPVFEERIKNLLLRDITIVVDEFRRLPERFLDLLHYHSPDSRVKLRGARIRGFWKLLDEDKARGSVNA
ncbi:hypothetical protein D9Q81_06625 [Candidatus Korarchaeum cryptofilum]|uniref:Uncharacterized protein n=1 Tax=Candidatus Korarchaeum cryptofilum TaxID=498846 RepID=A0A429G336_9CREN|nr:hypothetical protein [Candidatus Korarchaeum cryptofilum]RSN68230.1 hypothetical protein D9Q81_06625 [Candidatus Korarchaeum cryptofilum]